jgi:hypothetical protein
MQLVNLLLSKITILLRSGMEERVLTIEDESYMHIPQTVLIGLNI